MASGKKTKLHVTIFYINLLNMLTAMSPHHQYLVWPFLVARRARTRRGVSFTRVVTRLERTVDHAWRTARRHSGALEELGGGRGGHSYIGSRDPDLVPSMFNGVHFWTPGWRIHDLHILFCQKIGHVTCCLGRGIVLHKNSRRPGKLSIRIESIKTTSIGKC